MRLNKKYLRIVKELGLDINEDRKARDILDSILLREDWSQLQELFERSVVIIFGCGPSLSEDLCRFKSSGLGGFILVAVDGASKAFMEQELIPDVMVTDLDGDDDSLVKFSGYGCIAVVHAHGDNIKKMKKVVPKLSGVVYGTTQVEPTDKIRNFGGFTDGDRAVYLAERFKPKAIFLAGMDFGEEIGIYSGVKKDVKRKLKKLAICKKLIEELAEMRKVRIYNLTFRGEEIRGVKRAGWDFLRNF